MTKIRCKRFDEIGPWPSKCRKIILLFLGNKLLASAVISQCSSAGWNLVVDMRTLQQAYPFLKGSDIYLGETSCTGRELGSVLVFSNGLQECQTTETVSIEDRNVLGWGFLSV